MTWPCLGKENENSICVSSLVSIYTSMSHLLWAYIPQTHTILSLSFLSHIGCRETDDQFGLMAHYVALIFESSLFEMCKWLQDELTVAWYTCHSEVYQVCEMLEAGSQIPSDEHCIFHFDCERCQGRVVLQLLKPAPFRSIWGGPFQTLKVLTWWPEEVTASEVKMSQAAHEKILHVHSCWMLAYSHQGSTSGFWQSTTLQDDAPQYNWVQALNTINFWIGDHVEGQHAQRNVK